MVVDCSHLMVVVVKYVVKEPHLDVVESLLIAPINGLVAEMQADVDLQVRLPPPGSSRSEGYSHLWWILEVEEVDSRNGIRREVDRIPPQPPNSWGPHSNVQNSSELGTKNSNHSTDGIATGWQNVLLAHLLRGIAHVCCGASSALAPVPSAKSNAWESE